MRDYEILHDWIAVESRMSCGGCDTTDYTIDYDSTMEAAEHFYKKGWREIKDRSRCPECVKTILIKSKK